MEMTVCSPLFWFYRESISLLDIFVLIFSRGRIIKWKVLQLLAASQALRNGVLPRDKPSIPIWCRSFPPGTVIAGRAPGPEVRLARPGACAENRGTPMPLLVGAGGLKGNQEMAAGQK